MPRDNLLKGRVSLPRQAYHVTACTEARRPIFRDFACARLLVAEMRRLHEAGLLDSLAWVIMPDHLHWLFQLGEHETLSATIKRLKARSALVIGQHIGQGTPVWQRGFHDHAIRRDEDLLVMARYIIANPLRAGLVEHIGDYPLWDAIWL
ncbi:MAG: transposase [Sulfurimicrobium sp.]|nr:transposase [Sulfurimicrobium sp.]